MKFEQLNKFLNNKSEEKALYKKNMENPNLRNIQIETNEKENTNENFRPDNIGKSCAISYTTKNKSSLNNLEIFASISPINSSKNLNEFQLLPNKLNFKSQNTFNNQVETSLNNNNFQRKSLNEIIYSNETANRKPILIIDVKLKEGYMSHIKVYEGDTAEELSNDFADLNSKLIFSKFK